MICALRILLYVFDLMFLTGVTCVGSSMVIENTIPRLPKPIQPANATLQKQPSADTVAEAQNDIHQNNTIVDLDQLTTGESTTTGFSSVFVNGNWLLRASQNLGVYLEALRQNRKRAERLYGLLCFYNEASLAR